ncbi:MAG: hypothetical protein AAB858_03375 [Patescibacteria group bacterium]
MPHISKAKISQKTLSELDDQLVSFLSETSIKTRQRIFRELFTKTERLMIGKRLSLLFLLSQDKSTLAISEALKMSPSTVARFELLVSNGVFKSTCVWLRQDKIRSTFIKILAPFFELTFKRKSFSQMLDEH